MRLVVFGGLRLYGQSPGGVEQIEDSAAGPGRSLVEILVLHVSLSSMASCPYKPLTKAGYDVNASEI